MQIDPTPSEAAIAARIIEAASIGERLLLQGNGTKSGMLRPLTPARVVSTRDDSGITLYAPKELILSARAGTPLSDIEAALTSGGQHMIAEPPDLRHLYGTIDRPQTIGGIVATNLSGPRRVAWGAVRDHVLGVRAVTGRGELIHSGGRVLKNVTGLDLCKLFTGSHGTLGLMTEVTIKVLPAPESVGTLVIPGLDAAAGVAVLSQALGSPYGVSGAAWLPADAAARVPALAGAGGSVALVRIEDFAASVVYRTGKLAQEMGKPHIDILDDATSRSVWQAIRDARALPATPDDAVWRVSVRPSAGPTVFGTLCGTAAPRSGEPRAGGPPGGGLRGFLDWGGGLVWLAGPADAVTHEAVEIAARAAGGHWTLMRGPDSLRSAVAVIPPEPEPLARITRRVKDAFDPKGILNPGRFSAGQ
ncbi:MAG: FAD-binding protein [Acetobacteraceae bacterium]